MKEVFFKTLEGLSLTKKQMEELWIEYRNNFSELLSSMKSGDIANMHGVCSIRAKMCSYNSRRPAKMGEKVTGVPCKKVDRMKFNLKISKSRKV